MNTLNDCMLILIYLKFNSIENVLDVTVDVDRVQARITFGLGHGNQYKR